jgi:hypothetical protein
MSASSCGPWLGHWSLFIETYLLLLMISLRCCESYLIGIFFLVLDVPKLQPHPGLEKKEEEEEEEEYDEGSNLKRQANKNRVQSGPRTPNPYASDNSSLMFPILVAFGVFIPTLFCLCRL